MCWAQMQSLSQIRHILDDLYLLVLVIGEIYPCGRFQVIGTIHPFTDFMPSKHGS
jgi:hypothetical protein